MKIEYRMITIAALVGIILTMFTAQGADLQLPDEIAELLPSIKKHIGDSDTVDFQFPIKAVGFGNCEYVYITEGKHCGFHRIRPSNLQNPVAFPSEIKEKMLSNGRKIHKYEMSGNLYFGNEKFAVVFSNAGEKDLVSFSNDATLTDFCRFTERLYDEVLSPQMKDNNFPPTYKSLIELCIESHIVKLNTACVMFATGLSYGPSPETANRDLLEKLRRTPPTADSIQMRMILGNKVIQRIINRRIRIHGSIIKAFAQYIFEPLAIVPAPFVFDDVFTWSEETKRIISSMSINQLLLTKDSDVHPALKLGEQLSLCDPFWLRDKIEKMQNNTSEEIRESNYNCSRFQLERCENASTLWSEVNRKEYLTTVANLIKINKGILEAVAINKYDDGFEDLSILADRWRPVIKRHVRNYHYLFSDLFVIISCHRAFDVAREADGFWSKDRAAIKGSAQQWMRACADGEACRYIRSNYTADIVNQYHGYIKKLLGEEEYKRFSTSLKISYKREDDEFPSSLK